MDIELISKFGAIAGLGGISLGVLLFTFRAIIQKQIFPKLTKDQAYRIINKIIYVTTFSAITGIASWTYLEYNKNIESLQPQEVDSKLKPEKVRGAISWESEDSNSQYDWKGNYIYVFKNSTNTQHHCLLFVRAVISERIGKDAPGRVIKVGEKKTHKLTFYPKEVKTIEGSASIKGFTDENKLVAMNEDFVCP